MADAAKTRKPSTPHGFDLQLGTAEDVARLGEVGLFLGLKTKAALQEEFEDWLMDEDVIESFFTVLRDRARQKLDGPKSATGSDSANGLSAGDTAISGLTPDGGFPLVPAKEGA